MNNYFGVDFWEVNYYGAEYWGSGGAAVPITIGAYKGLYLGLYAKIYEVGRI